MRQATCREVQGAIARAGERSAGDEGIARHVQACTECRAQQRLHADVREKVLGADDVLDDLTRARVLARLLEPKRAGAAASRKSPPASWRVAVAALVLIAGAFVWQSRRSVPHAPAEGVALQPYAVHATANAAPELSSKGLDRLELPSHASMRARLGQNADLVLLGPLELSVHDDGDRRVALELPRGMLVGDFDGSSGKRLRISTADATVDIVGTRFLVEASPQRTRVSVEHGRVRVESRGRVRIVDGGRSWTTDREEAEALAPREAQIFERAARGNLEELATAREETAPFAAPPGTDAQAARGRAAVEPSAAPSSTTRSIEERPRFEHPAPAAPASRPVAVSPARARARDERAIAPPAHARPLVAMRDPGAPALAAEVAPPAAPAAAEAPPASPPRSAPVAGAPIAAPMPSSSADASAPRPAALPATRPTAERAAPPAPATPTASSLYRRAEVALRRGDDAVGRQLLGELVRAFPNDATTDSARYELALLAEKAGDPSDVLAQTHDIVRTGAASPFVEPARFLRCRAYLKNDRDAAALCLGRFVADYPASPHDEAALRALIELHRDRCAEVRKLAETYLQRHPQGAFAAQADRVRSRCEK